MSRLFRRKLTNFIVLSVCFIFAIIAIVPLISILIQVTAKGIAVIDLDFFTKLPPSPGADGGGLGNAILGTIYMVGIASLLSIPVGVMAGIYASEFGNNKLAKAVKFISDVLSGVPSIVIGIFGYIVFVKPIGTYSAFAGGASLAIIMIPLVVRTTEEMLLLVSDDLREASLALGATSGQTIMKVVLPSASKGIITGVMLSVARAAGETAPLLFTALNSRYWPGDLLEKTASLPIYIYNYAISPYDNWQDLAWGGSLVLITMILLSNVLTRYFANQINN
ncbi:MAG: phosphate ABC transporter permease PstA [Bacillota bacterium]